MHLGVREEKHVIDVTEMPAWIVRLLSHALLPAVESDCDRAWAGCAEPCMQFWLFMTLLMAWALLSGTPLPPTMEATARLIGCIAVLNLHHPSVYVSYISLDMRYNAEQALLKHSFKDIQDLAWYKTSQKLHHDTGITFIYALEWDAPWAWPVSPSKGTGRGGGDLVPRQRDASSGLHAEEGAGGTSFIFFVALFFKKKNN